MEKFLTVRVGIRGVTTINTPKEEITSILFGGTVEGECFNGTILDGGVDVIHKYTDGSFDQFARYAVKGIDEEGTECLLYIENRAVSGEEFCKPVLRTDSKALDFINETEFSGKVFALEKELYIEIYRL